MFGLIIFITHHFKILHPFGTIIQLPWLNIFHTICGPHVCHSVQLFLFFVFFFQKKKKKKGKIGQKLRLSYDQRVPHVCLITKSHWVMSYGNWKQLKCDGNRVIESQTTFCVMGLTIFELWVMEIEIWVMKIDEPNTPLVTWWNWCQARRTSLEWIWGPLKSFTQSFKIEIQPHSSGKIGFLVV